MNNIYFHKNMPTDVLMQYCHDSDDPALKVLAAGYEKTMHVSTSEVANLKEALRIFATFVPGSLQSELESQLKLNDLEEYIDYV